MHNVSKEEKKKLISNQIIKIDKFIKKPSDWEDYYKKGDFLAEKITKTGKKKQGKLVDEILPFIESASNAIRRLVPEESFLAQTYEGKIVRWTLLDERDRIAGMWEVSLESEKTTIIKEGDKSEMIRKKIESVFKPYFLARKV